jgi:hypothetical protein
MKLARSGFYYKPNGKSPEKMKADADLRDRIEAICLEFPRYPPQADRRVTHQLTELPQFEVASNLEGSFSRSRSQRPR